MSLVVIQMGHVPRTSGATGAPGEQDFARATAAKVAPLLRNMGHSIRIINADESRSKYEGDLFFSVHYDSSANSSASGASVGYQNAKGAVLAQAWKRAYRDEGWTRGFRDDNYTGNLSDYYGVREAIAAGNPCAIITESGFHTNKDDRALISPERTARSIARAVGEITNTEVDDMSQAQYNALKAAIADTRQDLASRLANAERRVHERLAAMEDRDDLTEDEFRAKVDAILAELREESP